MIMLSQPGLHTVGTCWYMLVESTFTDVLAAIALTRLIGEIGDVFASFSREHFGLDPHWDVCIYDCMYVYIYIYLYTHVCVCV